MSSENYAAFVEQLRELGALSSVEAVLDWDQETQMPPRGAADRARQSALLAGLAHEKLCGPELGGLLDKVEQEGLNGDIAVRTNVRETRRLLERARRLPTPLVKELSRVTALARPEWAAARRENDFDRFAPHLERILELKREVAQRIGYANEPYDALLDEFEPGMATAAVAALFDGVKANVVELLREIQSAPRRPDGLLLTRHCPADAQVTFCREVAKLFGFDFEAGRLDTSTHPFCSGFTPADVRITTRYDEHYLPGALFGVMHEVGHGLYEQGLDGQHTGTPMARAVSLGIHESQSRLWENQVGRCQETWEYLIEPLRRTFPSLVDVGVDEWVFAINTVEPSLIRVEADEVTYALHIMLRFDIERRLIRGELAVKDLPRAWNAAFRETLGIVPPTDAQGCLQDIHWSQGMFGYFPTYALGSMYAAQFFAAARRALPDLADDFRRGEFRALREWLREAIHRHGMRYRAKELVEVVTGRPPAPDDFMAYLNAKYRGLYALAGA